ncbi:hypothetical protein DINM_002239 [Dirofilaria immitis]|nr:hypothetical protein [Dirofilaria immitis]
MVAYCTAKLLDTRHVTRHDAEMYLYHLYQQLIKLPITNDAPIKSPAVSQESKDEDWKDEALNPIVTPVSDEDEFSMDIQKRKRLTQVTASSTEDEKKKKMVEKTQESDL